MSRRRRIHYPGALYHVILRGNARADIFFDRQDRRRWEALIDELLPEHGHQIHAYCWMSNHVHLALQSSDEPIAQFIAALAGRYAKLSNHKLGRSGHLFERRYRAILVQADAYLLELVRYIHQNPIRAGMVACLSDYPWCSHGAYLGGVKPSWLTVDWVLRMFDQSEVAARQAYSVFLTRRPSPSMRDRMSAGNRSDGRIIGDDHFQTAIAKHHKPSPSSRLTELVQDICDQHGVMPEQLATPSRSRLNSDIRADIGNAAIEQNIARISDVARFFNRSSSGLSRAMAKRRKYEKRNKW